MKQNSEKILSQRVLFKNEIRQVEQTGLKCYKYGFFSRGGFTCEKEENRILIELSELYRRGALK